MARYSASVNTFDLRKEFHADAAWARIRKVPFGGTDKGGDMQMGVNFSCFEAWWKDATGMQDSDIPVLPEFMVLRIEDKIQAGKNWDAATGGPRKAAASTAHKKRQPGQRSKNWTTLAEKLRVLVRMRGQWGDLHNIYETRTQSMYEDSPLPPWIRDPNSLFSVYWDFTSVVFLLYVTVMVPLRSCFSVDVPLGSVGFYIDLVVDLFFIADVIVNLRTAFYDKNGFRENRPNKIAKNYIHGWFAVDLFSCLPVGYLEYIIPSSGQGGGDPYRGLKALRLFKMTKMLRLARFKKVIERYSADVNLNQYFSIVFTLFLILFLAHMLACFFFFVGESNETLSNGVVVLGWVANEQDWWLAEPPANTTAHLNWMNSATKLDPAISLSTIYFASLYYGLNALEGGYTTNEHGYAVFAELVNDIILGLVAGLITTISISRKSSRTSNSQSVSVHTYICGVLLVNYIE